MAAALDGVLAEGLELATSGMVDEQGRGVIDHIAATPDLKVSSVTVLSKLATNGMRLSDHPALVAVLEP